MMSQVSCATAERTPLFDPIAMEVFSNRLLAITEEMGNTLVRASFSPNIKERKDCSVALFDARGRLIAQAAHIPMHLGSLEGGVIAALKHYGSQGLRDGDAFICNDAYLAGGTHAPDITIVTPIFCDGELAFFAANIGHHADVGGIVPGTVSPAARTVFDEGVRIPAIRVLAQGLEQTDVLRLIAANSREPEDRIIDLRVQIAVNERGKRLMLELTRQAGLRAVQRSVDDMMIYTERRLRQRILAIGDRRGSFTTTMDDDGLGGPPIPITATVSVEGDRLVVDFAGTGGQSPGGFNMPESALRACVFYSVKTMLDPELIANEGMIRCVEIRAQPGTITCPRFPAAIGMRASTSQRVSGAIIGAFNQVVEPHRAIASSNDAMPALVVSGQSRRRAGTYVYVETIGGGVGAHCDQDGADGTHVHITNSSNLPAEALENEYPLLVEEYSLRPDSGGSGQRRGGLGIARQIRVLDDDTFCFATTEGTKIPAAGFEGGQRGGLGRIVLNPGRAGEQVLPANRPGNRLQAGDSMRVETPGGGGFGEPDLRDEGDLARDLLGGKLSLSCAQREYGDALALRAAARLPTWWHSPAG